jgi:hypothetical protein
MSFTGELEHLPIVDVIQLLHATRKSGILRIKSHKGESQLVFKEGYIVCANHLDGKIRIGKILIDLNLISPDNLDHALDMQSNAGKWRSPLIVTLLEMGLVKEQDAYRGLERLIELTLVEILTWKRGTFCLDLSTTSTSDEYKYYPGKITREINIDTQSILMDSLRIYDERMRDGNLGEEESGEDETIEEAQILTADDLGLADLDKLEKKYQAVFSGVEESTPSGLHRKKIREFAQDMPSTEQEKIVSFLSKFKTEKIPVEYLDWEEPAQSVIFYSCDELVSYCVTTVCKQVGILASSSSELQDVDPIIAGSIANRYLPILILDAPEATLKLHVSEMTVMRRELLEKYRGIRLIQLANLQDAEFILGSYRDGVGAVIPRPERREGFAAGLCRFLETLQTYLRCFAAERHNASLTRIKSRLAAFDDIHEPAEVALALLQEVSERFERSITLVVRKEELIGEKGIGINSEKHRGAKLVPGLRIPLTEPSIFRQVVEEGKIYFGKSEDPVMKDHIFAMIGHPLQPTVLLLPLKSRGKTVSIAYGDFGSSDISPIEIDMMEILASHASLILENSFYQKQFKKLSGR